MFTRWGGFVYRRRRWIAALGLVMAVGVASLGSSVADNLTSGGWLDPTSESAQVSERLEAEFGGGRSAFIALFRSTDAGADARSATFQDAIATTIAPVRGLDAVTGITGFAETADERFISEAGDAAYILIELDADEDSSIDLVDPVQAALATPAGYSVALTGFGPIQQDSARLSEEDLIRAETVSLPIAALVLILVFGSLIAAGMPLVVAALAIPTSIGLINVVAQQREMSIYVLNIATMLGLALAIDYSLFITSRFREELARGRTIEQAVERAVGTAGKAVMFSGIAVAIGLSGLLWFQATASELDRARRRDRRSRVRVLQPDVPAGDPRDARPAGQFAVGRGAPPTPRPSARGARRGATVALGAGRPRGHAPADRSCSCPVLAFLLLLGSPYLRLKQGVPDATVNPPGVPSRDAWVALQDGVPGGRDDADRHPRSTRPAMPRARTRSSPSPRCPIA